MPVAIRVIMVASPLSRLRHALERKIQPPQNTTGVERINPNRAIESPKGGMAVKPRLAPMGE